MPLLAAVQLLTCTSCVLPGFVILQTHVCSSSFPKRLLAFLACSPLPNLGWELPLSGSFRFPAEIAYVANAVLKEGMADTGFVLGAAPSMFPGVHTEHVYLYVYI